MVTTPEAYVAGPPFQAWCHAWAAECLRVLKPGGHLLAFGGPRTWHRLVCAIEDAGFEIRDSITWMYASGFPKSLDVSRAIERAAGDSPAEAWAGWGTALKPAHEPICVARKPLLGTVVANVLATGVGALNIGACRIDGRERTDYGLSAATRTHGVTYGNPSKSADFDASQGRWPTNVILSHAGDEQVGDLCADVCVPGCPVAEVDAQSGTTTSRSGKPRSGRKGDGWRTTATGSEYNDGGGASRFFPAFRYEAKANSSERPRVDGVAHPTVKPVALMAWLVRLVAPPDAVILDPFAGSGTTGEACLIEGRRVVLVERDPSYLPLVIARLAKPLQQTLIDGVS